MRNSRERPDWSTPTFDFCPPAPAGAANLACLRMPLITLRLNYLAASVCFRDCSPNVTLHPLHTFLQCAPFPLEFYRLPTGAFLHLPALLLQGHFRLLTVQVRHGISDRVVVCANMFRPYPGACFIFDCFEPIQSFSHCWTLGPFRSEHVHH